MINVQALIGTKLGSCTIQKLIGHAGMGTVFLAEQTRPQRQVAVEVLSPPNVQTLSQRTQFLERFRQEIKSISSLEHPHIVPIYAYGEHESLAYLVMPYIDGGTLRDLLAQQQPIPLPTIASYLDQLASALDYAHTHQIIHRDVRPANILRTSEGQLSLTGFGLVQIAIERHSSQMRLLKTDTPIGSLAYMAPEQVMGDLIDARTDLYSLGIVLYQMITGKTPFEGGTPMQTATKLVQSSPPSPRQLRPDLPIAAEQVILQALAKRSQDRYERCQDFANAFRAALTAADLLQESSSQSSNLSATKTRKRSLFDPVWQNTQPSHAELSPVPASMNSSTMNNATLNSISSTSNAPATLTRQANPITPLPAISSLSPSKSQSNEQATPVVSNVSTSSPSPSPTRMRMGLRASLLRSASEMPTEPKTLVAPPAQTSVAANMVIPASSTYSSEMQNNISAAVSLSAQPAMSSIPSASFASSAHIAQASSIAQASPVSDLSTKTAASNPSGNVTRTLPNPSGNVTRALPNPYSEQESVNVSQVPNPVSPFPPVPTTGALMLPGSEQGTVKLTGAMKVVQVPVAGQPGRFVTGLLPVLPQTQPPQLPSPQLPQPSPEETPKSRLSQLSKKQKMLALFLTFALICFIPGILFFSHEHPTQMDKASPHSEIYTPDTSVVHAAQETATANANNILIDPLTQNIHNWPIADSGYKVYIFENGAYHILDNDANQSAPAILPDVTASSPMAYTLTMQEVKGNDGSANNSFGMIFRFTSQVQGNQNSITFYSFEVVNTHGGEYQFWKYDNSHGRSAHPWTSIWHHAFNSEFHQGQGSMKSNTIKVTANSKYFTFIVNNKQVGSAQDASLTSGEIGMLVNLQGTEVAFSNLMLTYS